MWLSLRPTGRKRTEGEEDGRGKREEKNKMREMSGGGVMWGEG